MKYRSEYTYSRPFGRPNHSWVVIGARVAAHLHIGDLGEEHERKWGDRYSGGIELHYRYPPEYMRDDAPSHDQCWVLKAPCWHDGSSLAATEKWIPLWRVAPDDHDRMFALLSDELHALQNDRGMPTVAKVLHPLMHDASDTAEREEE